MTIGTKTMCAILVPHSAEFQGIRETIARILKDTEVGLATPGMNGLPGSGKTLYEDILQLIAKADLIIADITGGNPNIMYEVGFAQALKKPVLLVVRSSERSIPSDLSGQLFFVYEPEDAHKDKNLEFAVRTWVERHTLAAQSR